MLEEHEKLVAYENYNDGGSESSRFVEEKVRYLFNFFSTHSIFFSSVFIPSV